jgi:hypothetical protein
MKLKMHFHSMRGHPALDDSMFAIAVYLSVALVLLSVVVSVASS